MSSDLLRLKKEKDNRDKEKIERKKLIMNYTTFFVVVDRPRCVIVVVFFT